MVVEGTTRTTSCDKTKCKEYDSPLPLDPGQCGWEGKFTDPNHLTGSQIVVKSNLGFAHNGTMTWTLDWNLARQGSSQ